jgi:predicted dehydrogenase
VGEIRRKGLRVIGAHVSGLDREAKETGTDVAGEIARSFLEHLARGELRVDDLCPDVVRPGEAGAFYHRLSVGDPVLGARFEWHTSPTVPPATHRLARLLAPPSVGVRGIEADGRPRRSRRAVPGGFPAATGRVRFGLIGCGEIAVQTANGIATAPNTSLSWCFDTVSDLAADLAAKHGANVAPTLEALLERDDVDAVVISVPHHLHAPLSIEAMRAGKHVVTEKPPASSLADVVAMATVARATGVAFSVFLPHRYAPETAAARQLIREGALGTVTGGFAAGWLDKPPMYVTGGFTGRTVSDWRGSRERAGGGVLIMNASHTVDAIRFLSGLEIEEVVAGMGALDAHADVEDAMAVVVRLDNGAIVTLHAGAAVRGVSRNELRLWGTDGHVQVSPSLQVFTRRSLTDLVANRWQSLTETQPATPPRALFLSSFASAVTEGRPPDVGIDDALALQAAIEAMYHAATTGSAVRPGEVLKAALGAGVEWP